MPLSLLESWGAKVMPGAPRAFAFGAGESKTAEATPPTGSTGQGLKPGEGGPGAESGDLTVWEEGRWETKETVPTHIHKPLSPTCFPIYSSMYIFCKITFTPSPHASYYPS